MNDLLNKAKNGKFEFVFVQDILIDTKRNRQIPVNIYIPRLSTICQVLIFSHGLSADYKYYIFWAELFASNGYIVIFPTHIGVDSAALVAHSSIGRLLSYVNETPAIWLNPVYDVKFVIDSLESQKITSLKDKVDIDNIAVIGHSMGGFTALMLAGCNIIINNKTITAYDKRIKAFIPLAASITRWGMGDWSYSTVPENTKIMTIAGSRDTAGKEIAFLKIRSNDKYHILLERVKHFDFTDNGKYDSRKFMCAAVMIFLDAYLRSDKKSLEFLKLDFLGKSYSSLVKTMP